MLHLYVHDICLLAWHKFLNSNIHACVVYARLQKMIDAMKNQHAQDSQIYLEFDFTSGTRALFLMLISQGIQWLQFSSGIQQIMALRMVFKWQLRLISCFKGPFFTPQRHLVDITSPHFLIHAYVQAFKSKLLAHMQVELILPIWVDETCL